MLEDHAVRAVGLFSGIGGFELGLSKAGFDNQLSCENWDPAVRTLQRRFRAEVVGDIRELCSIPACDVVTAGFPCTDLSQVGRTAGIDGAESGLISEVFRLIAKTPPPWVVLENVPNMLSLHGGAAIRHVTRWFDDHGWNWAYRTVDSQYFGVRQRRRRVILIASQNHDPRAVLFADETAVRASREAHRAYGFYWTEGNRGIGWGGGITPTLKGGSKLGIASPPGVWIPECAAGSAIVRPSVEAGERLQGFPSNWTSSAEREGVRWKLIGNAVTVPMARWVGDRLVEPGDPVDVARRPLAQLRRWPAAASSVSRQREAWSLSERPKAVEAGASLHALLGRYGGSPLSLAATKGFTTRLKASSLRSRSDFVRALDAHIDALESA